MGLKIAFSYLSGDVALGGASDRTIDRAVGVDRVRLWSTGGDQTRAK